MVEVAAALVAMEKVAEVRGKAAMKADWWVAALMEMAALEVVAMVAAVTAPVVAVWAVAALVAVA